MTRTYHTGGITEIKMERTGCYGPCPRYTVDFQANDQATYEGRGRADRVGSFSGTIDFARFAEWLATQNYIELADGYGLNVIDAQGLILTITDGHGAKVIRVGDTAALPAQVYGIVAAIDGAADKVQWRQATKLDNYLGAFARDDNTQSHEVLFAYPSLDGKASGSWRRTWFAPCERSGVGGKSAEFAITLAGDQAIFYLKPYTSHTDAPATYEPAIRWSATPLRDGLLVSDGHAPRFFHRISWHEVDRSGIVFMDRALDFAHRTTSSCKSHVSWQRRGVTRVPPIWH